MKHLEYIAWRRRPSEPLATWMEFSPISGSIYWNRSPAHGTHNVSHLCNTLFNHWYLYTTFHEILANWQHMLGDRVAFCFPSHVPPLHGITLPTVGVSYVASYIQRTYQFWASYNWLFLDGYGWLSDHISITWNGHCLREWSTFFRSMTPIYLFTLPLTGRYDGD